MGAKASNGKDVRSSSPGKEIDVRRAAGVATLGRRAPRETGADQITCDHAAAAEEGEERAGTQGDNQVINGVFHRRRAGLVSIVFPRFPGGVATTQLPPVPHLPPAPAGEQGDGDDAETDEAEFQHAFHGEILPEKGPR